MNLRPSTIALLILIGFILFLCGVHRMFSQGFNLRNPVILSGGQGSVTAAPAPITTNYLLLETGDYVLLETGDKLMLENVGGGGGAGTTNIFLLETGDNVLLETGDRIILD